MTISAIPLGVFIASLCVIPDPPTPNPRPESSYTPTFSFAGAEFIAFSVAPSPVERFELFAFAGSPLA